MTIALVIAGCIAGFFYGRIYELTKEERAAAKSVKTEEKLINEHVQTEEERIEELRAQMKLDDQWGKMWSYSGGRQINGN